jgi:hypothetical protein
VAPLADAHQPLPVLAATEKGQQLARADLAAFIVEQLITDTYMNQTVTIANR